MSAILNVCADRVRTNYAAETGADPAALPPGTIGVILNIITQLLPLLLGTCKPTTTPTPTPADSAQAIVDACKTPTWLTHYRIRRAISNSGGLEPGMRMIPTINSIIATGAQSTADEVIQLTNEVSQ